MNKIGYAAVNETLKPDKYQSCRLNTVLTQGIPYLKDIYLKNLDHLERILLWNVSKNLLMYRFPSNIFPLFTHKEVIGLGWDYKKDEDVLSRLDDLRCLVKTYDIRLTVHPDQFIVLNSNKPDVVKNSVIFLEEICTLLEFMGGSDCILHVGGRYGNKDEAMSRFVSVYSSLPEIVKDYLRLENDDVSYDLDDVLSISSMTGVPVVLDVHHFRCLMHREVRRDEVERVKQTWNGKCPKIHISSGKTHEFDKRHADYIDRDELKAFLWLDEVDVMVEAKSKELAALAVYEAGRK